MWANQGDWGDTRVQENEALFSKWLDKMQEPRYLHSSEALYTQIGHTPKDRTQNSIDKIDATAYYDKAYVNEGWGIQDHTDFIGFNGEYTWVEYAAHIETPGYYTLGYDYASGIEPSTWVYVNGIQQGGETVLPMTGEDWVTFNQESGQTIQFTYSGDYILRIVAPKAGLNLRAITLSQSNASVIPGTISAISTYAEENISLNPQEASDLIGFGSPGSWASDVV